ncbi:MAG TPA: hypothetical protein VFZ73_09775 [Gemmatimonadaceae bacterium]
MPEFVTFLLAPIGYAGLTFAVVQASRGHRLGDIWRLTTLVVVTHVLLVWSVRYDWQFSEATRNGYIGFAVFHVALAAILLSHVATPAAARRLVVGAFLAVSLGAIGATFRYDVVNMYRIPVLFCAVAGSTALVRTYAARRRTLLTPND